MERLTLVPAILALGAALTACGETQDDAAGRGKAACLDQLHTAVSETRNDETGMKWEDEPEFKMSEHEDHQGEGTLYGTVSIPTHAGIPWDHTVRCIADTNEDPAKVTFFEAEVQGL